jgi:hypothetical protein
LDPRTPERIPNGILFICAALPGGIPIQPTGETPDDAGRRLVLA